MTCENTRNRRLRYVRRNGLLIRGSGVRIPPGAHPLTCSNAIVALRRAPRQAVVLKAIVTALTPVVSVATVVSSAFVGGGGSGDRVVVSVMEKLNNIEVMHDIESHRPDHHCLFEAASEQAGYFTTAQADACGYPSNLRTYHVKQGRWVRFRRGIYRLSEYPSSDREEVIAAWLWAGKDIAVVSHESALDLLDLSDVIPGTIHITVPRSRRYRPAATGITLHTTTREFEPGEVITRGGLRVTSAVRTILDCAEMGTAPEQIVEAVKQARDRALATRRQLETAAASRGGRVERLIRRALEEAPS